MVMCKRMGITNAEFWTTPVRILVSLVLEQQKHRNGILRSMWEKWGKKAWPVIDLSEVYLGDS